MAALEVSSSFLSEEVSATLQQSASSTEVTTTPEASKSVENEVEGMIPKIELEEAGDLGTDGKEVVCQSKVREADGGDVKCDNNNCDVKLEANKESAIEEETAVAAMGAATAAAAAGVAAAATTNGNSGAAAAKSTLKYNPIGE